ncbi:MAG: YkvA family protein [Acidimicrobiales bacterium]
MTVRVLVLVGALIVASWGVLVLLARRLPPGILKDLSAFLPACVSVARRLRRDPAVPLRAKVAVGFAALWVLSPIDLIPEFLPVIGPLDDVVVVAVALRYAARQIPRSLLFEAWPAEPRLLERLLGPRAGEPGEPTGREPDSPT